MPDSGPRFLIGYFFSTTQMFWYVTGLPCH
jgi:hypothetical protein